VSRDEYRFNRPENLSSTFCLSADGSQNIWLVIRRNIEIRMCSKMKKNILTPSIKLNFDMKLVLVAKEL
jgi:hypothetical protein